MIIHTSVYNLFKKGDWMMEVEGLECEVCQQQMNDIERKPRNLPCGHTLCSPCITAIIERKNLICPLCQKMFTASSASDLPVNFGLCKVIEFMVHQVHFHTTEEQAGSNSEQARDGENSVCNVHRIVRSHFCTSCEQRVCQLCAGELHPLAHGCETFPIGEAIKKLKQLYDSRKSSYLSSVEAGIAKLKEYKEKIHTREKAAMAAVQGIMTERQQVERAIAEGEDSKEALMASKTNVTSATTLEEIITSLKISRDCENRVHLWTVTNLQNFPKCVTAQSISKWLEVGGGGGVYAIQNVDGVLRHAKLTLEGGKLLLHALKNEVPPNDALKLQYERVRALVNHNSALIFLDLAWGKSTPGSVYVRLLGDTGRGLRFLMLCTGERGMSYLGMSFQQASHEEGITLQKFRDSPDGKLADVPIESNQCPKKVSVGMVGSGDNWQFDHTFNIARQSEGTMSQFTMYLREHSIPVDTIFGLVDSGLRTVVLASAHNPITEVKVQDCGVIIPMD